MSERQKTEEKAVGLAEWLNMLGELTVRGQQLWTQAVGRHVSDGGFQIPDPFVVGKSFLKTALVLQRNPGGLFEQQADLWRDYLRLWTAVGQRLAGEKTQPVVNPETADRRFKGKAWQENVVFSVIQQAYLIAARWVQATVRDVEGLDPKTAEKVDFYARQYIDAMAPTNFAATHPQVWEDILESGGKNLLQGVRNLLRDMERGKGRLAIAMTDYDAFAVGGNIATTPGKVIFQNDLMQLIQYAPTTQEVARRPLLIVPPWINKFYILDLQPNNSFIRWAVEQGHTVFVISWVNPDERLSHKTFEDYLTEGPLAALDVVAQATGEREVNAIGYCIGGTLLACTLAYLAAREDSRIKSATFFTTMVDFADVGELSVFIDEEQLALLDQRMQAKGYLEGSYMATVFNMLRDNDLIWSFVVNNYLLGKEPRAFDLLYWNSDSTRMPAMMHSFYLRKMYLENRLVQPGGIELKGVPIDLTTVKTPVYILSTREDHIAPWKSTYAATQLYAGPIRFVLGASGHIAGVMNPPSANKYVYWKNSRRPRSPDTWFANAKQHEGSWWPDWSKWVRRYAGGTAAAREPGGSRLMPFEDAPGSYVKVRHQD